MDSCVKDPVTGAHNGFVIKLIRQAQTGGKVVVVLRNNACLRVIRISLCRLRQPGFFITYTPIERESWRQLPGVLKIEVDVTRTEFMNRIAKRLRERLVVLGARRI